MILCIETATTVCSVALCSADGVVAVRESREIRSHASLLTVFIVGLLKDQGIKASDLEAVAVSKGPGSYTGLRIGVSAAKGIAYASSIPVIGIETTLSMFHGMKKRAIGDYGITDNDLLCPMLDARRMEVYYCLYTLSGAMKGKIAAEIIGPDSFSDVPPEIRILFFGDGALKCENTVRRTNSLFSRDYNVSAAHMHIPAYEAFNQRQFEDIAYFEPFYLKDFIATIPKKNIAGL